MEIINLGSFQTMPTFGAFNLIPVIKYGLDARLKQYTRNVNYDNYLGLASLGFKYASMNGFYSQKSKSIPYQDSDSLKILLSENHNSLNLGIRNNKNLELRVMGFQNKTYFLNNKLDDSARVTLKSNQELAAMRSIGEYEVQLSQIAVDRAQSELNIAELNTDRCIIRAPYDGVMSKVFVNEYESIERQQPLIEIIGSGTLEAKLMISSKWLSWLSEGYPVSIVIDENGLEYSAQIHSLGADIDPVSQTIDATAQFDKNYKTLLPGMSGTATF